MFVELQCILQGVVKRDHTMFQLMKHFNIPIAYLMGGGYQVHLCSNIHEIHLLLYKPCVFQKEYFMGS